jgi:predicted acyl esterase
MLLGQQDHQYPLRTDWGTELLRWFDFWLKGIPNGIMDEPPVVVMDNTGVWHFEKDFPPSNATRVSYVLGADGSMAADCGGGSQGNGAVGCSAGSLPYLATGITRANDPTPGPDKVIFTTAPASRTIHISGVPTLTFNATIQGADTQFIATLYDVNGTKWTPLDWAALDARHRSGPNGSEDVPAGQAVAYRLSFFPMDYAWAAGHRLALTVAGSGGFWLQTPGGFSPVAVPVATSAGLGLSPGPTEARVVITTGAGSAFTIPTQPGLLAERPQPAMAAPADLPWTS